MNQQKDKTKLLRSFGFVMGGMLCIFTGVFFYKKWLPAAGTLGFLASCFILFALIAPGKLEKIHAGWMKFGEAIGRFNAKIILGFFFLVFFTVFRIFLLLLRKDFLQRKFEPAKETYWKNREPVQISMERYEQQY